MTIEEMQARITALEESLAQKRCRTPGAKAAKDAARAKRKQFKLDAWKRAHLHTAINRYYC